MCEALLAVTWLSDSLKIGYITYDNSVSFVKVLKEQKHSGFEDYKKSKSKRMQRSECNNRRTKRSNQSRLKQSDQLTDQLKHFKIQESRRLKINNLVLKLQEI